MSDMPNASYFLLFNFVSVVNREGQFYLVDAYQKRTKPIGELLAQILSSGKSVAQIKTKFAVDEGLQAYLNVLTDEQWGFLTGHPERFPKPENCPMPSYYTQHHAELFWTPQTDLKTLEQQFITLDSAPTESASIYVLNLDIQADSIDELLSLNHKTTPIRHLSLFLETALPRTTPLADWLKLLRKHPRIQILAFNNPPPHWGLMTENPIYKNRIYKIQ
jgi:hypothetical protein